MQLDLTNATWKIGSFSNGTGGNNCVAVAFIPGGVALRHSKNPQGPVLVFTSAEWTAFIESAKEGEFG